MKVEVASVKASMTRSLLFAPVFDGKREQTDAGVSA